MAVDVAGLALKVDSRDVKRGKGDLVALEGAALRTEKATKKMELSFKLAAKATIAMTVAFAAFKAKQIATSAALMAARYETLGVSLNVVGKNAGYVAEELNSTTKSLERSGISMSSARSSTIKMIQAHIDLSNATKLSRIAQDAAVIGNINSSEAFERLVYGIQTAQIEVLKTIGLNVNFENSYKKLAKQLGINQNELTENQKTQARLNVVMERGRDIAGTYEAAMTTSSKKINSFSRYIDDFKVKMGEAFGPAITILIDNATRSLRSLTDSFTNPQVQMGLKTIAENFAKVISAIIKFSTFIAEYAGLRSVTATFFEGMELAKKGIIDQDAFIRASFIERQKMVDSHREAFGKFTGVINDQTEGFKVWHLSITKSHSALNGFLNTIENFDFKGFGESIENLFDLSKLPPIVDKLNKAWIEGAISEKQYIEQLDKINKKISDLETIEKTSETIKSFTNEIDSAFVSLWADTANGFDDFADTLMNSFTNMLAEMAHRAITQQIMFNMGFGGAPITVGAAGAGYAAAGALLTFGAISNALDSQSKKDDERFKKLSAEYIQQNQLTGSILGDINSQSKSISESLEAIHNTDVAGLEISKMMLDSLNKTTSASDRLAAKMGGFEFGAVLNPASLFNAKAIDAGITVATQSLSEILTGGFVGGTYSTHRKSGGLFSSDEKLVAYGELSGGISEGISDMFSGVADALSYGARVFGVSMDSLYSRLAIAEQKISLKGLTAAQAAETISAFVSQTADSWAKILLVGTGLLDDFQKAGEGAFETMARLINETDYVTSSLSEIGVSYHLSGVSIVKLSQALISAAGGIDSLKDSFDSFYGSFLSESEKQMHVTNRLKAEFESLNMILPSTRDGFRDLVQGLIVVTDTDAVRLNKLLELSNMADTYYSSIEKSAQNSQESLRDLMEKLESEIQNFHDIFDTDSEKIAKNTILLRNAFYDLDTILPSTREGFKKLVEAAAGTDRYQQLLELSNIADKYYSNLGAVANAMDDAADAAKAAAIETRKVALENAKLATQNAFSAHTDAMTESYNTMIQNMNDELDTARDSVNKINSAFQAFGDAKKDIIGDSEASYIRIQAEMFSALEAARGGDISAALAVSGKLEALTKGPITSRNEIEYRRESLKNLAALSELESLTGHQLSTEEKTVSLLEQQIEAMEKERDALKTFYDDLLKAMLKVDGSVLTTADAVDYMNQVQELIGKENSAEQINSLLKVDDSVMQVADAVEYLSNIMAAEALAAAREREQIIKAYETAMKEREVTELALTVSEEEYEKIFKATEAGIIASQEKILSAKKEEEAKIAIAKEYQEYNKESARKYYTEYIETVEASKNRNITTLNTYVERIQALMAAKSHTGWTTSPLYQSYVTAIANARAQYEPVIAKQEAYIQNAQNKLKNSLMQYDKQFEDFEANALARIEVVNEKQLANISLLQEQQEMAERQLITAMSAMSQAQLAFDEARDAYLKVVGTEIPGFASGGTHYGGPAIVGERGPELVNLPPSRIYSNNDSKKLLDISGLIIEVKALREEVKEGNNRQYAVVKNTQKTAKILDRWDDDGQPAERQVA